jgi:hypothetical protein
MRRAIDILAAFSLTLTLIFPVRARTDSHYFPETGHTVQGKFLAYWQQYGGLATLGYPMARKVERYKPSVNPPGLRFLPLAPFLMESLCAVRHAGFGT